MTKKTLKQMAKEINTIYREDGLDAQISIVGRNIFLVDYSIAAQGSVYTRVEKGVKTYYPRVTAPVILLKLTPGELRQRYHDHVERRVTR